MRLTYPRLATKGGGGREEEVGASSAQETEEPTTVAKLAPTLQTVINYLARENGCGATTKEQLKQDNMTWFNGQDIMDAFGASLQSAGGIMHALELKGLAVKAGDSRPRMEHGEKVGGHNWVLTDAGIRFGLGGSTVKRPSHFDHDFGIIQASFPVGKVFYVYAAGQAIVAQAGSPVSLPNAVARAGLACRYGAEALVDLPEAPQLRRPKGVKRGWVFTAPEE